MFRECCIFPGSTRQSLIASSMVRQLMGEECSVVRDSQPHVSVTMPLCREPFVTACLPQHAEGDLGAAAFNSAAHEYREMVDFYSFTVTQKQTSRLGSKPLLGVRDVSAMVKKIKHSSFRVTKVLRHFVGGGGGAA